MYSGREKITPSLTSPLHNAIFFHELIFTINCLPVPFVGGGARMLRRLILRFRRSEPEDSLLVATAESPLQHYIAQIYNSLVYFYHNPDLQTFVFQAGVRVDTPKS